MKERPILFSGAMVRAILDGRKTQTRRVVKPQPQYGDVAGLFASWQFRKPREDGFYLWPNAREHIHAICPYGQPGDRLWVRETWGYNPDFPGMTSLACFRADPEHKYDGIKWKPSIHMPRAACRLMLEITGVRVERLNDCSEADAEAEGIAFLREVPDVDETLTARQLYECLWDGINGASAWEANPWVWVVEFKRITA